MNNFHVIHDAKAKYPPIFLIKAKYPPIKAKYPPIFQVCRYTDEKSV